MKGKMVIAPSPPLGLKNIREVVSNSKARTSLCRRQPNAKGIVVLTGDRLTSGQDSMIHIGILHV
jgi:hypothetical protein